MLRRTKDVIQSSLPAALEVVVFCRPSAQQLALYEKCIDSSWQVRALIGRAEQEEYDEDEGKGERRANLKGVLPLISTLRRLCNHPDLVKGKRHQADDDHPAETLEKNGMGLENDLDEESGADQDSDEEDTAFLLLGEQDKKVTEISSQSSSGSPSGDPPSRTGVTGGGVKATNNGSAVGAIGAATAPVRAFKVPCARPRAGRVAVGVGAGDVGVAATGRKHSVEASPSVGEVTAPEYNAEASGKLAVLQGLLRAVRRECPSDKVR